MQERTSVQRRRRLAGAAAAVVALAAPLVSTARADAITPPLPSEDSFYSYSGTTPLSEVSPGTVLKTRNGYAHITGIPLPVKTVQLLYRTNDFFGRPTTTVTTVLKPTVSLFATPRLISYQPEYDSLTESCQPSYALSGGVNPADVIDAFETSALSTFLLAGYTVTVPDYEGQKLAFAAGTLEGRQTLDGVRATLRSPAVGIPKTTKVGMVGYSGGSIATEWAAELATTYAPELTGQLVGAAAGGLFVNPARNLDYVNGTPIWASAIPAALVGVARGYDLDIEPYLSTYGKSVVDYVQDKCLPSLLAHWPNLTYQSLFKPEYQDITSVPVLARLLNNVLMGTGGTPSAPLLLGVGTGGTLEGTPGDKAGIGPGDGVMVTGDVRSLARKYCSAGVPVQYDQYNGLDHVGSLPPFLAHAHTWLAQRFANRPVQENCASIAPGNPLEPLPAGL